MRILNQILPFDPGGNLAPWDEYGPGAPTAGYPFKAAPLMSRYTCITSGAEALYVKTAETGAATDWVKIAQAGGTVTGDITFTGTVTAGDVVIAP
jgi:hypothetical protein